MSLQAAARRYEHAVIAVGGVTGGPPPCPLGLELARARVALVDELRRAGWQPDPPVMRQLQRDRARVYQGEAGASRVGPVDGAALEQGPDLGLASPGRRPDDP